MPAVLMRSDIEPTMEDKNEDASSEVSNDETQGSPSVCSPPAIAVPEKILLCLDISQDCSVKPYTLKDDNNCNPFLLLKKSVISFVHSKHTLNDSHEFAVMTMEPGGVKWVLDFSSDINEVADAINKLELICLTDVQEVNLTPIFKETLKQIRCLPLVRINTIQFPPHIVRLILVYSSSYNIPKVDDTDESFVYLTSSKYFHWDILYLHDAPTKENKCQDIFNALLDVSLPGSYVFESSRKIVKVFNSMAKLLPHPLQRFEQPYLVW